MVKIEIGPNDADGALHAAIVGKIDENANIKMRVLRSSVTRVYKKDA